MKMPGMGKDSWVDTPVGKMSPNTWRDLKPDDPPPTKPTLEWAIASAVDIAVSNAVRRHLEHTDVIGASVYEAVEAFLVSPVGRDTVADAVERAMRDRK